MRLFRLCFVVAIWLVAPISPLLAGEVAHYRLDNGLEVILAPDSKVPKFGMTLVYRVGSSNEPAGRSGFAHLFEHLMFSGTAAFPHFDDIYSALGVANNATTEEDRTRFVAEGLSSALPVVLSVEADRMANLGADVSQEELDLQRSVVKNEMRQNLLDVPGATGVEVFKTALFASPYPYSRPVIGSVADLDAATLGDVRAFFETHYGPNNAILSVAGDFDLSAMKAMIADTFGRVPRRAEVGPPAPAEAIAEPVRLDMADHIPAPLVTMGIAAPDLSRMDDRALTVAADLLGNPEYGVLRRELVDTGLASSASAGWESRRLAGLFVVSAMSAEGVSAEKLEAALRTVVANFAATTVDPQDLERTRRSILLNWRLAEESLSGRAATLALRSDLFGSLDEDKALLALTTSDVERASRELMRPDRMSVLTLVPGTPGELPPLVTASTGEAAPIAVSPRPLTEIPSLAAGEPGRSSLPARQTATLGNGIKLVHYQVENSPRVILAATVTGGTANDIPGKEGLIELTAEMMTRGAGDLDAASFSRATKDIGAELSSDVAIGQSAIVLAVPPETLAGGVQLLADVMLRPRLEAHEWDILKTQVQQGLAFSRMSGDALAYYAMQDQLFPTEKGQPALDATAESVGAVDIEDIRSMYRLLFVPGAMTIYSVGSLSLQQVAEALETAVGGWNEAGAGLPAMPPRAAHFGAGMKVLVVPPISPETQSTIYVARPAPGFKEPGFIEANVVSAVLGGDFTSRLNQVLREQKGYSYGVNATVPASLPQGGMLAVSTAVQADRVGDSLAEILKGFAGLATDPVSAEELARSAMSAATANAGSVETSAGLLNLVATSASLGMTAEQMNAVLEGVVALQLPSLRAEAEALSSLDPSLVVISGDPAAVLPQLRAIGVSDATVLGQPD